MQALFIILSLFFGTINGYRILGLFLHPGRSHSMVFNPLMRGLAERGHEVFVVSYFEEENPPEKYHDLKFEENLDISESYNISTEYEPRTLYEHFYEYFRLKWEGEDACDAAFRSSRIDEILEMHKKIPFDLVITEFFNTDCNLALVHILGAPFIGLSSCILMPWNYDRVAIPDTPSYIPSEFIGASERMTFWQRFVSFTVTKGVKLLYRLTEISDNRKIRARFGEGIPDVRDIARRTALIFVNSHFSMYGSRPLQAAVVEIGGIHIAPERPLPEELKRILDQAEKGVVVVSYGSLVKGSTLPEKKQKEILEVFGELEQEVIWKWEAQDTSEKPKNVHFKKWLPQRDILCHPNVRLFIAHGGNLGLNEAVNCGVPVVVTPFYETSTGGTWLRNGFELASKLLRHRFDIDTNWHLGDQYHNGAQLEYRGMAVVVKYEDLNKKTFAEAIKKALSPEFKKNATKISLSYKNRPMSPMDTAIWWVEYVIWSKGELIGSYAREMNWFTYNSLDVISVLVFVPLIILVAFYRFLTSKPSSQRRPKAKSS